MNPQVTAKSLETEKMVLNFGPSHPATHGTLRVIMELDGETVIKATPEIGFLHSGFEKLGEHLDFNQYVTITDRMTYAPTSVLQHVASGSSPPSSFCIQDLYLGLASSLWSTLVWHCF